MYTNIIIQRQNTPIIATSNLLPESLALLILKLANGRGLVSHHAEVTLLTICTAEHSSAQVGDYQGLCHK
jgi:hypothetical protein